MTRGVSRWSSCVVAAPAQFHVTLTKCPSETVDSSFSQETEGRLRQFVAEDQLRVSRQLRFLMPAVKVRRTSQYGDALFATSDIPAGSIFLAEDPLLCVPPPSSDLLDFLGKENIDPSSSLAFYIQGLITFESASEDVKSRALALYAPDPNEFGDSAAVRAALSASAFYQQMSSSKMLEPEAAVKVALILAANAWSFDDSIALFELGSKFAHTCGPPSSRYSSRAYTDKQGVSRKNGHHVAVRDIAAGELITTSYFHGQIGNPERRQILYDRKAFYCACDYCSGSDLRRQLPCPACTPVRMPGGRLAPELLENPDKYGFIVRDPASKRWTCSCCNASFPDNPDLLLGSAARLAPDLESKSCTAVLAAEQQVEMDLTRSQNLLNSVFPILGPKHWASHLARIFLFRAILGSLDATNQDSKQTNELIGDIEHHAERIWKFCLDAGDDPVEFCGWDFSDAIEVLVSRSSNDARRVAKSLLDKLYPTIHSTRNWEQPHILLDRLVDLKEIADSAVDR